METSNIIVPAGFGQVGSLALNKPLALLEPPSPVTVGANDSLQSAIELLQDCHIGCAVVTDENGALCGMLSERDILIKWIFSGVDASQVKVVDVMTAEPTYIDCEATIATALYLMSKGGFRHLPIVDNAKLPVGIVSVKDITDFISMEFMRNLVS